MKKVEIEKLEAARIEEEKNKLAEAEKNRKSAEEAEDMKYRLMHLRNKQAIKS